MWDSEAITMTTSIAASWLCTCPGVSYQVGPPGEHGSNGSRCRHRVHVVSTPTEMPLVVRMTDGRTGEAHLVTEDAVIAGCRAGRYPAVCGVEVLPASLTIPERGYCPPCARGGGSAPGRSGRHRRARGTGPKGF